MDIAATGEIDSCMDKFMDFFLYNDTYVSMTAYTDKNIGQLTNALLHDRRHYNVQWDMQATKPMRTSSISALRHQLSTT